jgi:hypothetical protein
MTQNAGISGGIETGTLRLCCNPQMFGACSALAPLRFVRYILRDGNLPIATDGDVGRARGRTDGLARLPPQVLTP